MRHGRGRYTVKVAKRQFRRNARIALKQGLEPERVVSVPYTD
jgi:hypothetical protein